MKTELLSSTISLKGTTIATQSDSAGDIGQFLSQVKGVNIRRSGGLRSDTRFSLNGLTDDQIRFFINDNLIAASLPITGFYVWWGRKNKSSKKRS